MSGTQGPPVPDQLMADGRISFASFAMTELVSFSSQPLTRQSVSPVPSRAESPSTVNSPESMSTIQPQKDSSSPPAKPLPMVTHHPRPMGWWWEVAALLLSTVCMALILAILFTMDGRRMRDWRLPIQPNSLIAVFSTISKSALLVPLAECIGQLKWTYFQTPQSKPVNRLYDFDLATRGPWGSLTFLFNLRLRKSAVLASFGAALTILSLGFEPFTQQVLRVYSKPALLVNTTGTLSSSKALSDVWNTENADLAGMEYTLAVGVIEHVSLQDINLLSNVHCPTAECKLDQFTSLGLCDSCTSRDVSVDEDFRNDAIEVDDAFAACSNTAGSYNSTVTSLDLDFGSNYTAMKKYFAAGPPTSFGRACTFMRLGYPDMALWIETEYNGNSTWPRVGASSLERLTNGYRLGILRLERNDIDRTLGLITANNDGPVWNPSNSTPQIKFCIGDYERYQDNVMLDPYKLPLPAVSAFACFKSTSDITRVAEIDRLGLVNGTISYCTLNYCAKRYSGITVRNAAVSYESVEEWPLHPTGDPYKAGSGYDQTFRAEGLNETFYIGNRSTLWLGSATSRILKSTILSTYFVPYHERHTWPEFFRGFADVGSKVIQGPGNSAAINNTSEAYGPDIFVDVRWAWLAYPLALLVYSALFLSLTALGSRRRSYLFKNSILAVLVHGLEGWNAADCPELLTVAKERNSDLKRALEPAKASFTENDDGLLKLKRD